MAAIAERSLYRGTAERLGFERAVRVVESLEPTLAQEFVRATNILLREVKISSEGDSAWTGGLLNRTGAPLEFSFDTRSPDLRYAVEPGGPQFRPELRLALVDRLLAQLGEPRLGSGIYTRFCEFQESARLRFGAWLGVRHRSNGFPNSFKIYAEVGSQKRPAASALISEYMGSTSIRPESKLVLLGAVAGSDRCEFYFELDDPDFKMKTLHEMLTHIGLSSQHTALLDLVNSFDFRSPGPTGIFPSAQFGFSYSMLPGGRAPAFSIFIFARDLAGGDGLVRRQVLDAALSRGWTLGCYRDMTEPMDDAFFQSVHHNMISFVVDEASVGLQVSVCPPPHTAYEG